jgi:hypothetical protein
MTGFNPCIILLLLGIISAAFAATQVQTQLVNYETPSAIRTSLLVTASFDSVRSYLALCDVP